VAVLAVAHVTIVVVTNHLHDQDDYTAEVVEDQLLGLEQYLVEYVAVQVKYEASQLAVEAWLSLFCLLLQIFLAQELDLLGPDQARVGLILTQIRKYLLYFLRFDVVLRINLVIGPATPASVKECLEKASKDEPGRVGGLLRQPHIFSVLVQLMQILGKSLRATTSKHVIQSQAQPNRHVALDDHA
jgi:hypothetical protein